MDNNENNGTKAVIKIDVEGLLRAKNPQLLRILPRFVVSYIKRVIHQDEINDFLEKNNEVYNVDFADSALKLFNTKIKIVGIENIPKEGNQIVVSNHPLGGLDGIALISVIGKYRSDVVFPVNDLLLYLRNMNGIFLPINKHGRNSSDAVREFDQAFASKENVLLYFPAGLCSRKIKGKITDLEWKKTVVTKAKKYNRDIVPVYFEGRNRSFFYNLSNIRKFLGIKANIEMFYLADEMYHQQNKTFTIYFGKPISAATFTKEKTDAQWSAWLKSEVYKLKE
jgi:putative hemolysin